MVVEVRTEVRRAGLNDLDVVLQLVSEYCTADDPDFSERHDDITDSSVRMSEDLL